ncbi:membrane protein [Klebsiella pneumoniae]|uniref:Membrane protein n=3 Tax=Klebsiella pneumoniae TaxID=573 RepID=A0A378ARJ0_KLEPO|nr:membrane protein [Klebsiella pneumoniae]STV18220.1 membrane protein [Klebsiella pneumoniae subsp. ozaenae]VFS36692.1 Protein of uncharacterised function (DUF554) [Serratia liquefaciens]STS00213.1 membrane protein [Klebsiella pneumoniae]STT62150.1 membrane protein [Klebsiella pneumoniae]
MAIGIFVCSGSLLVGALAGASLNRFIPEHFKKTLPLIAGLISISMGIFFVNKLHNLPPIALAIIVGTIGNDSNLLIVFYVQIMPDDLVMQLHRF